MAKLLKYGSKPKGDLADLSYDLANRDDLLLAITIDKNLIAQCHVHQQTPDILKSTVFSTDGQPVCWCCDQTGCGPCLTGSIGLSIARAVTLCLNEIARELYPEIYDRTRELYPDLY